MYQYKLNNHIILTIIWNSWIERCKKKTSPTKNVDDALICNLRKSIKLC